MNEHGRNRSDRRPSLGSCRGGNQGMCSLERSHGKGGGSVSFYHIVSNSIVLVPGGPDREHRRKGW